MCTAITFDSNCRYFGRNLDLEYSYGEGVLLTPRNFPLPFSCKDTMKKHYAIMGMGIEKDNYPLYFDAFNEYGLAVAGLNFPGNAVYHPPMGGKDNITPFEFIPWILGQCKTVKESLVLLSDINLLNKPFSREYPLSPLHWILADKENCIVIEPMKTGCRTYEEPLGVLTNEPPFPFHMTNLQNYLNLTPREPENRFSEKLPLKPYSRGMGGIGLPGDLSSSSRFIRAAFVKENALPKDTTVDAVGQFFHILDTVSQTEGCCITPEGYERTIYSGCCDLSGSVYYYTTYTNRQISAVRMLPQDIDGDRLMFHELVRSQQIRFEN